MNNQTNPQKAKKLTDRDKQAIATKNRIYQCGVRLMNQHGFSNITVEQIAKKAKVSVGTFYHYFQSKFDLLSEVYRLGDEYFAGRVPALLREFTSCAERVGAYFDLYAQLSLEDGIEMVRSLYVPTNRMFLTHGRAMQDLLTDILHQGQQCGEISADLSAQTITEELFLVARGVIFDWCLHDGKSDIAADMRRVMHRYAQTYFLLSPKKQETSPAS